MDGFPTTQVRVPLKRHDLKQMLRLVQISWKLLHEERYRQELSAQLPLAARFDPGYGAVMMGYDFHLTAAGPRLIEVNTNAGGAGLALRACHGVPKLTPTSNRRLLQMFRGEWQAFRGDGSALESVVIIDENPEEQALYPEMNRYAEWLGEAGISVRIVDPRELQGGAEGLLLDGRPVSMIYNRHCDFYLEEEALASIRAAYLAGRVCLTPNPYVYGHLADKQRMILWRDIEKMLSFGLSTDEAELLRNLVPESRLLADIDPEEVWSSRKGLVFKPVDRFGSKGVLLGKSISRKRFGAYDPQQTLVQELVPPSLVEDGQGNSFKADLRLFAWRDRALGVAARIYQGQVTNLQTAGGGFAAVTLE